MPVCVRLCWICCFGFLGLFACGCEAPGLSDNAAGRPPAGPARYAVLIGIDDYSASLLPPQEVAGGAEQRGVPNLEGAVNDVRDVREMLVARYGFAPQDIFTLTDQAATREAIFQAIDEHLTRPSRAGDIALFYYSGHGSQIANSLSDEPDHLDESIVPADWGRGAPDIRDKELRQLFNRLLDHKARLSIVLDSCHSGSGVRGYPTDARFRSAEPDRRDVKDGSPYGPRPEDRGALVLSAAQDFDLAWESRDEAGRSHGAFSLALVRAMRDATAGESATETFLRARARLQGEKRFQEPVLAGSDAARSAPLLGLGTDSHAAGRNVVAVERMERDGTVVLQGGWANGLTVGSELRVLGSEPGPATRLRVTAIQGPSRSTAHIVPPVERAAPTDPQPGALAEVVVWASPPGVPLRVWISQTSGSVKPASSLASELAREAPRRGVRWIADPTEETPTHVLRWRDQGWELVADGRAERLGPAHDANAVLSRIARARRPALFVQIPAPRTLVGSLTIGPGTKFDGVEPTNQPGASDYVLAGRLADGRVEYAWLRPGVGPTDRRRSGLPARTSWYPLSKPETGDKLKKAVLQLRKIHGWYHLDSPPGAGFPYELSLREENSGRASRGMLIGKEKHTLVLRAKEPQLSAGIEPRYVYAFVIDSDGRSILLFPVPTSGSVENHFPLNGEPREIPLGRASSFEVTAPYGIDTYFLLTSDEPLPNPWILEWNGVRTRGPKGGTPLEELLSWTGGAARSVGRLPTPAVWSLEKQLFESVPPRALRRAETDDNRQLVERKP